MKKKNLSVVIPDLARRDIHPVRITTPAGQGGAALPGAPAAAAAAAAPSMPSESSLPPPSNVPLSGMPVALPSPSSFYHDLSLAGAELGTPTMTSLAGWMPWSPRTGIPPPPPMTAAEAYTAQLTGALSPRGMMTPASIGAITLDSLSEMAKTSAVDSTKRREPVVEPTS